MTETLTFEDLVKLDKAAAVAAAPQPAGINEFIPKNLTDSIANAINKFAENPEKFVNSLQKLMNQPQPQQPQAVPLKQLSPPAPTTAVPITTAETQQATQINFDNFYGRMVEGLEDVLNTAGDMPLSKIVDLLKSNPDGCKGMLKPYFEEWIK